MTIDARPAGPAAAGRYRIFFSGRECGEERWELSSAPGGFVVNGEQVLVSPHPFPSRQEYRATLTMEWRVTGLEILWTVGERICAPRMRPSAGLGECGSSSRAR